MYVSGASRTKLAELRLLPHPNIVPHSHYRLSMSRINVNLKDLDGTQRDGPGVGEQFQGVYQQVELVGGEFGSRDSGDIVKIRTIGDIEAERLALHALRKKKADYKLDAAPVHSEPSTSLTPEAPSGPPEESIGNESRGVNRASAPRGPSTVAGEIDYQRIEGWAQGPARTVHGGSRAGAVDSLLAPIQGPARRSARLV